MATSGIYNATTMGVYIDGVLVAASTDASISGNRAEIDTTTKDSASDYEFLPGIHDYTITCNWLHKIGTAYTWEDIFTDLYGGTVVNVKVSTNTSGDNYYHGSGYLTGANVSFPMEDKASGDITIKVTGGLTKSQKT